MKIDIEQLTSNVLFQNINPDTLALHLQLESCPLVDYNKKTIVVQEGDPCRSVGLVLEGVLAVQQFTPGGESLTVKMFNSGDSFGTAMCGVPDATYPFTLVTLKKSRVLYIPFGQINRLLQNDAQFNQNFIAFLSGRLLTFKNKLQMIQHKDVRSRLMYYLTSEYRKIGQNPFKLPHRKVEIAEIIGVARPSVSREFRNMETEGFILLNKDRVTLLKPELFS